MPGFNIAGIGVSGQPANTLEPRRLHRWVLSTLGRGQGQFNRIELLLLKSATRPKFKFKEAQIDHNQETSYYAGKQEWEPMELTWYDIEQDPDISAGIYNWLETVVELRTANVSHPRFYKRQATLAMLSGMNQVNEQWNIYGTWPLDVDWKGLDYTSTEVQTCVAKMRFDRALRVCGAAAPPQASTPSCAA